MKRIISICLLVFALSVVTLTQGQGTPSTLRVRTDSTGALTVSSSAPTPPYTTSIFNNTRLKTDADGNLLVADSGGGGGTPGGADTNVQYNDAGAFGGDSTFTFNNTDKEVTFRHFVMPRTLQATPYGIMYRQGLVGRVTWMHNFTYGTVGMVTTEGHNTFVGNAAGNIDLVTAPGLSTDGSENSGFGYQALQNITLGHRNTCIGSTTCQQVTTENYNGAFGYRALQNAISNNNNAFGYIAGAAITTGGDNSFFGNASGALAAGARNTGFGAEAEGGNETGTDRIGLGYLAGKYTIAQGDRCKSGNFSIYIGSVAECSASANISYEYVFGGNTDGSGPYTWTLGNIKSAIQLSLSDAPTCGTNCGTSPTLVGNNSSFTLTMGATGSPASGFVITFDTDGAFTAAPQCMVSMGKTGMIVTKLPLTVVTTTTTITVVTNGGAPANEDVYHFICSLGK